MNLHEYQAKNLMRLFNIPVPEGYVHRDVESIQRFLKEDGRTRWVVKAQVHAGGRGKAGGVCLVEGEQSVLKKSADLLGSRLVTHQTNADGQPVNEVYLEVPSKIKKELYLSLVMDRVNSSIAVMASQEGGMDIEEVMHRTPELVYTINIHPFVGLMDYQVRDLAVALNLNAEVTKQFHVMMHALTKLFKEKDLSLLEINPLIITEDHQLICLDGKISVDDNALYRQKEIEKIRDMSQEDPRESQANQHQLNYVALDGNIGCMVNGAGLAMATMDLIQFHGGLPANFLDVGGGATQERVTEAFKLILSDSQVKAVLVNIFGGIVRCDLIAEGILKAVETIDIRVPVVVRLEGNRADLGLDILGKNNMRIITATDFDDAAKKVVAAAKEI